MSLFTDEFLASFDASTTDVATACTLPPEIYTDEAFLAFERRALFGREWLCVGLASQIPEPGDYFTTTANGEPIIVARGKDARRAGVLRRLSPPRHADRRRRRQLRHVHLPVPPVGLRTRRPAARRAGDGAHRRLRQEADRPPDARRRGVAGLPVRQLRHRRRPARSDAAALRAVPRALRARPGRLPGHVHPHRPAVELEGDVRELQRRLPRQPAAPHDPGLLPEPPRRVPGAVGRRLQRDLPHQRLHPHRRRLQRHDQGAAAGVPAAHRGGALAQHVRARAADALHGDRTRPGVLLHRPARRPSTRSTSRSATCCTRARSSTRCSSTCSR